MANLPAIVKATRASAAAIAAMQKHSRIALDASAAIAANYRQVHNRAMCETAAYDANKPHLATKAAAMRAWKLAAARYERAQAILANNPL